jgi:hypothetical protein
MVSEAGASNASPPAESNHEPQSLVRLHRLARRRPILPVGMTQVHLVGTTLDRRI